MRAFLVGGVLTKVDEHWDKTLSHLMAEAGVNAVESAGLSAVDAVYVANVYGELLHEQANLGSLIAEELGLKGVAVSRVEAGGVSGLSALMSAVAAVNAGLARAALVVGAEKLSDVTAEEMTSLATMEERAEYVGMLGVSQLAEAALLYKEYLKRYRVSQEEIAYFTVLAHEHASTAPHAQYPFKLSLDTVLKSPYVAEPLHRLETTAPADGAAALVVASEELARKLDAPKCLLTGLGFANDLTTPFDREDPLEMRSITYASLRALEMAGRKRTDIDFAELHDAYSIMAPLSIEALGLAERGTGPNLARKGYFGLSGGLPVNTFGGLKGRGNPVGASGIYAVVESMFQLTDRAGKNQADRAEVGLVQSVAGLGAYAGVAVLEAVR